jgi:Leucine-rich repeat (LRR) protein
MSGLTAFAGGNLSEALRGMSNIQDLELGGNRNQSPESLAAIASSAPSLRALKMSQTRCDDSVLRSLAELSNLRRLEAFGCQGVSDTGMWYLTSLVSLRELYVGECTVTREGLRALSALVHLKVLNIAGSTAMQDDALEEVGTVTSLLSLDLSENVFTDTGMLHLSTLTRLSNLNIAHCVEITDAAMAGLLGLTSLSSLAIGGCVKLTDAAMESLAQLPLRHLKFARSQTFTDEALIHVSRFRRLQTLSITRIPTFTNRGVAALGALTSLRELTLSGLISVGVTDTGLADCVAPMKQLEAVSMGGMAVGVECMAALAALPVLSSIDLNHCLGVNDSGMEVFAKPGSLLCLSSLNLSGCAITDAGIKVLVRRPGRPLVHLHRLAFSDCISLTDDALRELVQIPYLQSLMVNGCIGLTDAGVEALVASPSLERLGLGGCLGVSSRLQRAVAAVSATRSLLALPSAARSYPRDYSLRRPLRRLWFRIKIGFATLTPVRRAQFGIVFAVLLALLVRKVLQLQWFIWPFGI